MRPAGGPGGEGRALWTATTPFFFGGATFWPIARPCNREQVDALIGPDDGIVKL
jgi:hypothetical protein